MRRFVIVLALVSLALVGCKKPTGEEDVQIVAPIKPVDTLTPRGDEVIEVPTGSEFDTPADPADDVVTPPPPLEKTYVVQRKDTLWGIALKFYGDGKQWKRIAQANGITDPSKLPVGKVLKIPQ